MKQYKQGFCPICESMNINYNALEIEGDYIYYPCTCEDCGKKFNEVYTLNFLKIETT